MAFFMKETKLVDVLLIPGKPVGGLIKFGVDLNSGGVIKKFVKPKPMPFMKSRQDMSRVRDVLMIANNNPEIKRNFALMDFKKIPHIRPCNGNRYLMTIIPMNFHERMGRGLPPYPPGFEDRCNMTVFDVNVSIIDRRVLGFGTRKMCLKKKLEKL